MGSDPTALRIQSQHWLQAHGGVLPSPHSTLVPAISQSPPSHSNNGMLDVLKQGLHVGQLVMVSSQQTRHHLNFQIWRQTECAHNRCTEDCERVLQEGDNGLSQARAARAQRLSAELVGTWQASAGAGYVVNGRTPYTFAWSGALRRARREARRHEAPPFA